MSDTQLELNIIEKVKKILKVDGNLSNVELAEELFKYRNEFHPDKFPTEDEKELAKERFIECTNLYNEISRYINQGKMDLSPTELQVWNKDFDLINAQQRIILEDTHNQNLKKELKKARKIIKNLLIQNKKLAELNKHEVSEELLVRYKRKIHPKIGITINSLFAVLYFSITNIQRISEEIQKQISVPKTVIDAIVLVFFVFLIAKGIRQLIQKSKYLSDISVIETSFFLRAFKQYYEDQELKNEIPEGEIYLFVEKHFKNRYKFIRFWNKWILGLYDPKYLESLKSIFISFLLEKQLVRISNARKLDREFSVYGSGWSSAYKDIIDDKDIDAMLNQMDYEM